MDAVNELTKQERIVLALVAQGWRTAKIATELFVSPRTIETHIAHIFEKLGVSSRTEAAIYALRANLASAVEIRTNPDDTIADNSYAYSHEFNDSPRSIVRKEQA